MILIILLGAFVTFMGLRTIMTQKIKTTLFGVVTGSSAQFIGVFLTIAGLIIVGITLTGNWFLWKP